MIRCQIFLTTFIRSDAGGGIKSVGRDRYKMVPRKNKYLSVHEKKKSTIPEARMRKMTSCSSALNPRICIADRRVLKS